MALRAIRDWVEGRIHDEDVGSSSDLKPGQFPVPTTTLLQSSSSEDVDHYISDPSRHEQSLATEVKFAYGLGEFGITTSSSIQGFFLNSFLLEVAGLSPALAGTLLLVTKLLDAVSDPIVGYLSDNSGKCAKSVGRRRIWIILGILPFVATYILLWWVPGFSSQPAAYAYYQSMAILHSIAYTSISLPYSALAPELTSDYNERTNLMTFKVAVMSITMIVVTFGHSIVIELFKFPNASIDFATGYLVSAVGFGTLMIVPFLVTFCCVKENADLVHIRSSRKKKRSCSSVARSFRVMATNRAFVSVMLLYLFSQLAVQFVQNNLILWVKYSLHKEEVFSFLLLCFQGIAFLCLPLWERVSRKLGKKLVFYIGTVYMIIILLAAFYLSELPAHMIDWAVWIIACAAGGGLSVLLLIPVSMFPDVIETDELITGQRREGLFYSLFIFFQKIALSIALAVSNFILASTGYVSPEYMLEHNVQQSSNAIFALRVMIGPIPAAVLGLSLIAAYFYPITHDSHSALLEELDYRRMDQNSDREG